MRQLLSKSQYTFTPATRTITFLPPFDTLSIANVTLITNVTTNTILYIFDSLGGTLNGANLVLTYDTTAMAATDNLQIFIDVPTPTIKPEPAFQEILIELRRISAMLAIFTNVEVKDSDL